MGLSSKAKKTIVQRLEQCSSQPDNQNCAECGEKDPKWASILSPPVAGGRRIGVFCCYKCCSHHFQLGREVCAVKNLKIAEDWTEKEVIAMEISGNTISNAIYEGLLSMKKPKDQEALALFVEAKYKNLEYFCKKTYESHDVWFADKKKNDKKEKKNDKKEKKKEKKNEKKEKKNEKKDKTDKTDKKIGKIEASTHHRTSFREIMEAGAKMKEDLSSTELTVATSSSGSSSYSNPSSSSFIRDLGYGDDAHSADKTLIPEDLGYGEQEDNGVDDVLAKQLAARSVHTRGRGGPGGRGSVGQMRRGSIGQPQDPNDSPTGQDRRGTPGRSRRGSMVGNKRRESIGQRQDSGRSLSQRQGSNHSLKSFADEDEDLSCHAIVGDYQSRRTSRRSSIGAKETVPPPDDLGYGSDHGQPSMTHVGHGSLSKLDELGYGNAAHGQQAQPRIRRRRGSVTHFESQSLSRLDTKGLEDETAVDRQGRKSWTGPIEAVSSSEDQGHVQRPRSCRNLGRNSSGDLGYDAQRPRSCRNLSRNKSFVEDTAGGCRRRRTSRRSSIAIGATEAGTPSPSHDQLPRIRRSLTSEDMAGDGRLVRKGSRRSSIGAKEEPPSSGDDQRPRMRKNLSRTEDMVGDGRLVRKGSRRSSIGVESPSSGDDQRPRIRRNLSRTEDMVGDGRTIRKGRRSSMGVKEESGDDQRPRVQVRRQLSRRSSIGPAA